MISPEVFFALVDKYVTGPMESANYVKIDEYDHFKEGARCVSLVAAGSRGRATRRWPLNLRRPKERLLQVGFEGPGEADERWINYLPGTGELDLLDWREELDEYADRDVWNGLVVSRAEELEHRLSMVGAAMGRGTND